MSNGFEAPVAVESALDEHRRAIGSFLVLCLRSGGHGLDTCSIDASLVLTQDLRCVLETAREFYGKWGYLDADDLEHNNRYTSTQRS